MKFSRFFLTARHTKEEAEEIIEIWYKATVAIEIMFALWTVFYFLYNVNLLTVTVFFAGIIVILFMHLAIHLGGIEIQLGEINEKLGSRKK